MLQKLRLLLIMTAGIALVYLILSYSGFINKKVNDAIITHVSDRPINLDPIRKRLAEATNLALPLSEELELLEKLSEFELGRFLLEKRGLNGYWIAYIITDATSINLTSSLERWIIHDLPAAKATRERFYIFQEQVQKYTKGEMTLASIPCGRMDDFLTADLPPNVKFVGIDLDPESLELAKQNAIKRKKYTISDFIQNGAWSLDTTNSYDIITSNGLNIYEPDDDKVTSLYKQFFAALKPRGILITSFLTPPPALSKDSTWKNFNQTDIIKQKALFADILQVKWQSFRTELQTRQQLEKAGFDVIDIIYDQQGMFPTIVARKI